MNAGSEPRCPCCGAGGAARAYRRRAGSVAAPCYGARRLGVPNPHGEILVCPACEWGFVHPLPGEDELNERYRALVERDYLADAKTRSILFVREIHAVETLLPDGLASLLDVGCSYGLLLEAAARRGIRALGLDQSMDAVAYCRARGLEVRHGGLETLAPEERFDAAFLWDVLEHLLDPMGAMASVRRHLRPGGVVSIVVPNRTSGVARLLGERWWSVLDVHLHYPSARGLVRMVERAGFSLVHVGTHPKIVTGAQVRRWLGDAGVRAHLARLIPQGCQMRIDPKDQLLVRARAA